MDNQPSRPQVRQRMMTSSEQLPEKLLKEILSRLPATTILRFQLVCRKWKDLTSDKDFSLMHMKNCCTPMILVQEKTNGSEDSLWMIDAATRETAEIKRVRLNSLYEIEFSCGGLILLRRKIRSAPDDICIVLNPVTGEQVEIRLAPVADVQACGIFFHPLLGEHCILWNESGHFKMLILGSEPRWKELSTGSSVSGLKILDTCRVVVDDILYWLCFTFYEINNYKIVAFDIKREEIIEIPHPDPKGECQIDRSMPINLVKMNGHLSLVQATQDQSSLGCHIWIRKDYANGVWIKSYTVFNNVIQVNIEKKSLVKFRPVTFANKELIVQQTDNGNIRLVANNVESGNTRTLGNDYYEHCVPRAWADVPSLVSMKDWVKSDIVMPRTNTDDTGMSENVETPDDSNSDFEIPENNNSDSEVSEDSSSSD